MAMMLESHIATGIRLGPPARLTDRVDGNQGFPGTYRTTVSYIV